MNAHDVDQALTYLDSDVRVTFPEPERNWEGIGVAKEKFAGMFQRMPTFVGRFEEIAEPLLQSSDNADNAPAEASDGGGGADASGTIINVACHFQCVTSKSESERNMTYHIQNNLIKVIRHL
jgi:hypothetical protein